MIRISNLYKTFKVQNKIVNACQNINLHVEEGQVYGIIGYSGAGKSTLIRCLNFLEIPDEGTFEIKNFDPIIARQGILYKKIGNVEKKLKNIDLRMLRSNIGMIFQHFNLLDRSTVFENIAFSLRRTKMTKIDIQKRVRELLQLVDLQDKENAYPSELSGGQKQRVAIARALANHPTILLSDEATSALDPDATESILHLLKDLNRKLGLTIVLITHEMAVIKSICDRVAVMEKGQIVEEGNVYSIFSKPREMITRNFVSASLGLNGLSEILAKEPLLNEKVKRKYVVKLTFAKDSVGSALISQMSRDFQVDINILLANVEFLQGSLLGNMIVVFEGSDEKINDCYAFLATRKVKLEVIDNDTINA